MATYADFAFYQGTYMGTMSNTDFAIYAVKASFAMDMATNDQTKTAPTTMTERMSLCCCQLADLLQQETAYTNGSLGINSVNNDGFSVSYGDSKAVLAMYSNTKTKILTTYLTFPVNLMYAGV